MTGDSQARIKCVTNLSRPLLEILEIFSGGGAVSRDTRGGTPDPIRDKMSTVALRVTTCKDKGASVRGASLRTRVNPARSPNRPYWTPPSFSGRKLVALRAGDDEAGFKKAKDDDEDVGGDNAVQDALASELKFQTKLYQAQQYIEGKKDEFIQKGEEGKEKLDAEAKVFRDRANLELGLKASEIDEQLAEMLDETAAARARNERVQAELAELEEQLTGTSSGRFRKAPPKTSAPKTISAMKQAAIDKEAADVDARMRNTLEETQRKSAYTLILLLLVVTDISLVAEGAWDKFFAIGCVIALVGYQANNERLNK